MSAISTDDLRRFLRCPFCAHALVSERQSSDGQHGLWRCACSLHPVLAGIPILKPALPPGVRELAAAGRYDDALVRMLTPPMTRSWPDVVAAYVPPARPVVEATRARWRERTASLVRRAEPPTARELLAHYFVGTGWRMAASFDYFYCRLGMPRHLVGLAFARLLDRPARPVIDLACGAGHLTRTLVARAGAQPVIGIDQFFYLLWVARTVVAPDAAYVCCDADIALPFEAASVDFAFCSDAFFDFVHKAAAVRELDRVVHPDGVIALVGLRNALLRHLYAGRAIVPDGYRALAASRPFRMVSDGDVLDAYLKGHGVPLTADAPRAVVDRVPLSSIVMTRRSDVFRDHGAFDAWPHGEGPLALNPLYRVTADGALRTLTRVFPTTFYAEENHDSIGYLPDSVTVTEATLTALARSERPLDVERLVERFVVLGAPPRYS